MVRRLFAIVCLMQAVSSATAENPAARYADWQHTGSLWILTTPEGADLPATCTEHNFPLLVRLNGKAFQFAQVKNGGEDIRFSDSSGSSLAYQIEEWNASQETASIWVKIPLIKGNDRQVIRVHWGNPHAVSESNGAAVFGNANGFCSVLHLDGSLKDEVGSVMPVDAGTSAVRGMIGDGRHCSAGTGIDCGNAITSFPNADSPFSSAAWFRAEAAGVTLFGWGRYATRLNGKTGDGNEVLINIGSPLSLGWASDGPGGVAASTPPVMQEWYHVVATYADGLSQIYVNGRLDGARTHKAAMSMMDTISMLIGGGRPRSYNFVGDVDEVRVSKVARSADWIKLEYENKKRQQTLVGSIPTIGTAFVVAPEKVELLEGKSLTITAEAGGAQKVCWILKRDGVEKVVAVDCLTYTVDAGRVAANASRELIFKAVYADGVKAKEIPISIQEDIPEPVVTLAAPMGWNGRDTIEVVAVITNREAMQAKSAETLGYKWTVAGGAVLKDIKEGAPQRLVLKRSQYTGPITVQLAVNNGGAATVVSTTIMVTEPKSDAWIARTPDPDEQPEDHQFIARDDQNEGTLFYNGTLDQAANPKNADSVFLKVFANDKPFQTETQKVGAKQSYAFTVKLKPGLINYTVEFGTQSGNEQAVLRTVKNIVCGDAYIIDGQSNAEATGPNNGPEEDPVTPTSDWIRSYGNQLDGTIRGGWGNAVRTHIWGKPNYGCHQIGAWGMVLATNVVETYKIPICILNGAYGGTPIWQHQRNPKNHFDTSGGFYVNPYKIYGSLLTRVTAAKLTHGIRGVIWHQGENDSGSGAPTGDWNYKSYQQDFVDMSAAWKEDFPNIQHFYVFQVWPLPCSMGPKDDQVREAQRTLATRYSNLRVMSTVGISTKDTGRGLCHFDLEGYAQMARLMSPLLEQDNYGFQPKQPVTASQIERAYFTTAAHDEIALEFGQPMAWNEASRKNIYLDGVPATIANGSVTGNVITLTLTAPTSAKMIAYLAGKDWDGKTGNLIFGTNGVAALTFCDLPLEPQAFLGVGYQTRTIEGWQIHISHTLLAQDRRAVEVAMSLLQRQLSEIVRVVPAAAVADLQAVPLWFSPEYPGVSGKAEYHPEAGWLRENRRNPAMEKCVEFTNTSTFERETNRMPNFALHELAHAYHDRRLSFEEPAVVAAYQHAKAANLYESVDRWHGNGKPNTTERAYAMTNPAEYFAETTEAFFSRNDFFPFNDAQLKGHDPQMHAVLTKVWLVPHE